MPTLKENLLEQLDATLELHKALSGRVIKQEDVTEFAYSALGTIERATGAGSSRAQQATRLVDTFSTYGILHPLTGHALQSLAGIVAAIRNEVDAGYLDDVKVLVHADMFNDMLERAEYLLSEKYKDPAAVLGGGVLGWCAGRTSAQPVRQERHCLFPTRRQAEEGKHDE